MNTPAEGSGGSYGGRKGTYDVSIQKLMGGFVVLPSGWRQLYHNGRLEYRGVNASGLGAPAAQPRWAKDLGGTPITAGQAYAYVLYPSGSNVVHYKTSSEFLVDSRVNITGIFSCRR